MIGTYALAIGEAVGTGSYCADRLELQLKIDPARASRLSEKTHKLSSRISALDSEGEYPKETLQLKIANDYFL